MKHAEAAQYGGALIYSETLSEVPIRACSIIVIGGCLRYYIGSNRNHVKTPTLPWEQPSQPGGPCGDRDEGFRCPEEDQCVLKAVDQDEQILLEVIDKRREYLMKRHEHRTSREQSDKERKYHNAEREGPKHLRGVLNVDNVELGGANDPEHIQDGSQAPSIVIPHNIDSGAVWYWHWAKFGRRGYHCDLPAKVPQRA